MISRIEIVGLGPHKRLQLSLDPKGTTIISGPSEIGKTTILEAILLTLLGRGSAGRFQPQAINDSVERTEIRLGLDDGRILKRAITRSKSTSRTIITDSRRQSYSSEVRYAEALGSLVSDPEASRLIIDPLSWQPLVASNARPFRDVLTRAMPSADPSAIITEIMEELGAELNNGEEAWTEKDTMKARREARRKHSELKGQISALEEQLARLKGSADVLPDTSAAQAILDAQAQWTAWAGANQSAALIQEHARQRAALGDPPELPAPIESLEAEAQQAQETLRAATDAWRDAKQRHDHIQEQLNAFDLDHPDTCPTCSRPGWTSGAARVASLQDALQTAAQLVQTRVEEGQQARKIQEGAAQRLQNARQIQAKQHAWKAAMRALGAPPASSSAEAPSITRPTPDQLAAAKEQLTAFTAAKGAQQQRQADIVEMEARMTTISTEEEAAEEEANRLGALLEAIRLAPSRLAEKQSAALGDLGPVSLEFGDNPAVTVFIDGRPWWLASRGRQVVADMYLRAALRRAFGLQRLPLVVDNIQDVGGQPLPTIEGPVILLKTTDDTALSVDVR